MGSWSRRRREDSVFEEMDASRSDPCGAAVATQGEDHRAKARRLDLCQSGDWKTVLAGTLAGTSPSSRGKSGKDWAHWLAHISSHVLDSSASVRCGREGAARTAAPRRHSDNHEHLHAGSSTSNAGSTRESSASVVADSESGMRKKGSLDR